MNLMDFPNRPQMELHLDNIGHQTLCDFGCQCIRREYKLPAQALVIYVNKDNRIKKWWPPFKCGLASYACRGPITSQTSTHLIWPQPPIEPQLLNCSCHAADPTCHVAGQRESRSHLFPHPLFFIITACYVFRSHRCSCQCLRAAVQLIFLQGW